MIDLAKLFDRQFEKRQLLLPIRDVRLLEHDLGFLGFGGLVNVAGDDLCAEREQPLRCCKADARGASWGVVSRLVSGTARRVWQRKSTSENNNLVFDGKEVVV